MIIYPVTSLSLRSLVAGNSPYHDRIQIVNKEQIFLHVAVEDCVSTEYEEMHVSALRTLGRVYLAGHSEDIMKEWK